MIRRLELRNFQSIAQADLELGDWTALVGESDVGKSAVLRALWCLLTNARGEWFIRQGEPQCEVAVTLDSGTLVAWTKPRGRMASYIVRIGDDVQAFAPPPGAGMPDEVRALLPMTIEVAGDELMPGFQRQHEAPFLLADTARHRAQVLGEFDGTNLLLAADGAVRRVQREASAEATQARAAATNFRAEAARFSWLEDALPAAEAAHGSLERATGLQSTMNAQNRVLEALEGIGSEEAGVEALLSRIGDLAPGIAALDRAGTALMRAGLIADTGTQARHVVERAERLAAVPPTDLRPQEAALERLAAGQTLLVEAVIRESQARDLALETERVQASAAAAWRELVGHAGEPCPTCGRVLVIEELVGVGGPHSGA